MAGPVIGFHGKLPARGDFVTRGLPSSFLSAWEAWVDSALAASRALLGDAWREAWMTAPVWRFCLPGGACGPDPVLGVMMPSIDRVGRLYPLTVAVLLPGADGTPDPDAADVVLDQAEDAGRAALADSLDPDALRELIAAIPVAVATHPEPQAIWWTDGSHAIDPMSLSLDGLPAMPDHAAMLAGEPGAGDGEAPEGGQPDAPPEGPAGDAVAGGAVAGESLAAEATPASTGAPDGALPDVPGAATPAHETAEPDKVEPGASEPDTVEPDPVERGASEPAALDVGTTAPATPAPGPGTPDPGASNSSASDTPAAAPASGNTPAGAPSPGKGSPEGASA